MIRGGFARRYRLTNPQSKKKQAEVQVCASIGASVEREVELSLDGAEV